MKGIIYKVTNIKNNHVYIGQTTQPFEKRKKQHYYNSFIRELKDIFHNAIRKHGWDFFKFEILEQHDNIAVDFLNQRETFNIIKYDSFMGNGNYNMSIGGDNRVHILTEEHKEKISKSNMGKRTGFKYSKESKKKMSEAKKNIFNGKGNPFFGKHHSEETKKKIRETKMRQYREKMLCQA